MAEFDYRNLQKHFWGNLPGKGFGPKKHGWASKMKPKPPNSMEMKDSDKGKVDYFQKGFAFQKEKY